MTKELFIKDKFAEIIQINKEEQDNCIRVYCSTYPNTFDFQIRTFKPINEFGRGKPRAMIARVSLDIKQMEKILRFMKNEVNR